MPARVWRHLRVPLAATMDHRSLVRAGGYVLLVGGRKGGGGATDLVQRASVLGLFVGP